MSCPFAGRALGQAFVRSGKNSIAQGKPAEFWAPPALTGPSTLDAAGYTALVADIASACEAGQLSPPTLCRLGFHSVHIATAVGRGHGANGGFHQFDVDHNHPSNGGMGDDISFLLKLRAERYPGITHADLFSLAGSIAPELAGGPPIAWFPGRLDSTGAGPSDPALSSALPDGMLNAAGVQTAFEAFIGLTVRESVVFLGGGHSFGGATLDGSGWLGSFTEAGDTWPQPSNRYFIDLMNEEWVVVVNEATGKPQYVRAADGSAAPSEDTVFRLPADYALKEADAFRRWATLYARDADLFTRDFQRTYQRAMQVGAGHTFTLLPEVFSWKGRKGAFEGFGTAIAPLSDAEGVPAGAVA